MALETGQRYRARMVGLAGNGTPKLVTLEGFCDEELQAGERYAARMIGLAADGTPKVITARQRQGSGGGLVAGERYEAQLVGLAADGTPKLIAVTKACGVCDTCPLPATLTCSLDPDYTHHTPGTCTAFAGLTVPLSYVGVVASPCPAWLGAGSFCYWEAYPVVFAHLLRFYLRTDNQLAALQLSCSMGPGINYFFCADSGSFVCTGTVLLAQARSLHVIGACPSPLYFAGTLTATTSGTVCPTVSGQTKLLYEISA